MENQEYTSIVAKNIKRLAYQQGKTQVDIARDLGLQKSTISSWMNGKRTPKMDKIDILCEYFHCNRNDLMEPYDPNKKKPYYLDAETAKIAEVVQSRPEMKYLFDAARNVEAEDILLVVNFLKRLNTKTNEK